MLSSVASQTESPALGAGVEYCFQLSLYFLVATGFATLASTGGLDVPSLTVMTAALALRGYFLAKRQWVVISERWTTPLTLAYFAFFAADYFVVSHSFLPATVHLALFGVIIRMFSLRRDRDYALLAVLAFLMVLVSAVLTVDSVFLVSFALFLLMAVMTSVLFEMRRSGQMATHRPPPLSDPRGERTFAYSLVRVVPGLLAIILVAAAALFFILPRRSAGYLGGYAFGTDFSSGFSDHVQLGQIGQIQQSNAVVMHVQIEGDRTGRYDMRWRGVALGDFDGRTWSRPRRQYPLQKWTDDSFAIPVMDYTLRRTKPGEKTIHYRVLMEPIGTNVFFLAPWAESLSGPYQAVAIDDGGAVYDLDLQRAVSRYEADSNVYQPSVADLRSAGTNYPQAVAREYLQVPALDPRVGSLAKQITVSDKTSYDKATALESYLRSHYGYTLQLPKVAPDDPIANFLFERKQGHCEYFASSMAVMLRTLGIPSRVVNGFRSNEFNDLTRNYVVRAKDAHAWVEAYFPGYGWQTFDPTPLGSGGIPQGWDRVSLYLDAMASFWREWIISYDTSHQYVLGQGAISVTHNFWERARSWARDRYSSMLNWGKQTEERAQRSPETWILGTVGISFVFLILRNAGPIGRWLREYKLRAHPERSPEQAAAIWYRKMLRAVARGGLHKSSQQTACEFVENVEDAELREQVDRFTRAYEGARFGNSAEDAERLPELCEEVENFIQNS
jgi:transglutaminase-like putative cysteine protease